jgi:hypothetical protein
MTFMVLGSGGDDLAGPSGYTYAAVVVRVDGAGSGRACTRVEVVGALKQIRFSGWVAQPEDGWLVVIAAHGHQTVATGRRGVIGVGEWLAGRLGAPILALLVVDDRQLVLAVWADGEEIGRYVSDPSYGLDDDTLPDPLGVEHADAFAAACGHADAVEDLGELLAEGLDPDSVIESERLAGVLRLFGIRIWLVGVASLPHDVPAGPRAPDLTRLGAGREGFAGWLSGRVVDVVRRHRPPPPIFTDAPRGGDSEIEPWML